MLEVRTSKFGSWFFIIGSTFALIGLASAAVADGELLLVIPALLFGGALAIGIHTLRHPRELLRVEGSEITLFPGTLWSNRALLTLPRERILSMAAVEETDSEGTFRLLCLRMTEPLKLSPTAARWAAAAKRGSRFRHDPESVLIWPLSSPNLPLTTLNAYFTDYLAAKSETTA